MLPLASIPEVLGNHFKNIEKTKDSGGRLRTATPGKDENELVIKAWTGPNSPKLPALCLSNNSYCKIPSVDSSTISTGKPVVIFNPVKTTSLSKLNSSVPEKLSVKNGGGLKNTSLNETLNVRVHSLLAANEIPLCTMA